MDKPKTPLLFYRNALMKHRYLQNTAISSFKTPHYLQNTTIFVKAPLFSKRSNGLNRGGI
jgi:hypothetical protein